MRVLRRRSCGGWTCCVLGLSVLLAAGPASAQQLAARQSSMAINCVPDTETVAKGNYHLDPFGSVSFTPGKTGSIILHCPIQVPPWQADAAPVLKSVTIYFRDPDGRWGQAQVDAIILRYDPALQRTTTLKLLGSNAVHNYGYTWLTAQLDLTLDPKSYTSTYYMLVFLYRSTTTWQTTFYSYTVDAR